MAIATLSEIKVLLQISGTGSDTLINALIPVIQDFIITYTNNKFKKAEYYIANTIAFVSSGSTITDIGNQFVISDFTSNGHISVENSIDNDGIYLIDSVIAGAITLDSSETLIDEAAGEATILLQKVEFPKSLKMIFASMINIKIQKKILSGIKSESLADHSITLLGEGGYPKDILEELNQFRKIGV